MLQVQVTREHYNFKDYMTKERWCSLWHQVFEIAILKPRSVLEIGVGSGLLKAILLQLSIPVTSVDLDPELQPDYVASIECLPFKDNLFDVVCAFQVLEHLPYESSLNAFRELARITSEYVIISLPNSRTLWRYLIHIPKLGILNFAIPRPEIHAPEHHFDGQHYWEIGKRGFSTQKVVKDLSEIMKLAKSYRVSEYPYHHFFVFRKNK